MGHFKDQLAAGEDDQPADMHATSAADADAWRQSNPTIGIPVSDKALADQPCEPAWSTPA